VIEEGYEFPAQVRPEFRILKTGED